MSLKRINVFGVGMTDNTRDKRDGAALEVAELDIYKSKDYMTTGTKTARCNVSHTGVTLTASGTTVTGTMHLPYSPFATYLHRFKIGQTITVTATIAAFSGTVLVTADNVAGDFSKFQYTISPGPTGTPTATILAQFTNRHVISFATGDDDKSTLYALSVDTPKDATIFKLEEPQLGTGDFVIFEQYNDDAALYNDMTHHRVYMDILSITLNGGIATVLTDGSNDIATGDQVIISGADQANYNKTTNATAGAIQNTVTNISFTAGSTSVAPKITRATSSWITNGFTAGMTIRVSGSTGGVNDTSQYEAYTITSVTATILTLTLGDGVSTTLGSLPGVTVTVSNAFTYPVSGSPVSPATSASDNMRASVTHLYYITRGTGSVELSRTYILQKVGPLGSTSIIRKQTDRTNKTMTLGGFQSDDGNGETPGGPFPMIRLQGIQIIGNGQYVATIDGTGAYNERAFQLPNGWICQSFAPFNYSIAILAKSTIKAESSCRVFFWDLTNYVQPYAEAYIPAAEPTIIFNQQGALYVVCVEADGVTRIYQLTDTGYAVQTHRFSDTNTYQFGATGRSTTVSILDTSKITQNNRGLFGMSRDVTDPAGAAYLSGGLMAFGPPQGAPQNALALLYGAMSEVAVPTSITSVGTTATVTLADDFELPLYTGMKVEIYNANESAYNSETITSSVSLARVATTVTGTKLYPHGLSVGDYITVTSTSRGYPGTYQVATTPTTTQFTYIVPALPGTIDPTAVGTMTPSTDTGVSITVTSTTTFTYIMFSDVDDAPATGDFRADIPQLNLGVSAANVSGSLLYNGVYNAAPTGTSAPIVGIFTGNSKTTDPLDGIVFVDQSSATRSCLFNTVNLDNNLPEIPKEWSRITLTTSKVPLGTVITLIVSVDDATVPVSGKTQYKLTPENAQNTFSGDTMTFWERDLNFVSRSAQIALAIDLPDGAAPVDVYSLTLQYNNVVTIA